MSSSSLLQDRNVLCDVIRKLLFTETREPLSKQARRALFVYARANELIDYAKGNDAISTASQKAMINDGRVARALALATLDEVNEARPLPFMPFPIHTDADDIADGHVQMLLEAYAAPFAQHHPGPFESYAQMLVDILSFRRGLCWPNQQRAT
jgi:hypothetical protein